MGKQTMGTPCYNWQQQSQTKMYRLQTPAAPLFRPVHYDNINMDDFAMGTNAIIAVISYTVSVTWFLVSKIWFKNCSLFYFLSLIIGYTGIRYGRRNGDQQSVL